MDREEELTKEFLRSEGYSTVVYEPDGNVPPDFSIDGVIAVEVRRLNQNYTAKDGTRRSLEEDEIPLLMTVRRVLAEFGAPEDRRSWFVSYRFRRPLARSDVVADDLRAWLEGLELPGDERREENLACGITVWVFPSAVTHHAKFVLGMTRDRDSGGWVLHEVERNILICLEEKTHKVKAHLDRYERWWLALVDYIGYGLSEFEQALFANRIDVPGPWSRIVIVNPITPSRSVCVERENG